MNSTQEFRLGVANKVLALFCRDTQIELVGKRVFVNWTLGGNKYRRQWMCRGQDFYPVWFNKWGHGGTCSTALSQLVRWVQGKPVLPLGSWRYWTSERIALGQEHGKAVVDVLREAGYPETVQCVKCGRELTHDLDWYNLAGVSGPGHIYKAKCEKAIKEISSKMEYKQ